MFRHGFVERAGEPVLKVPVVPVAIGLLNVRVWTGASTVRSMGIPLAELLATLMLGTLAVPLPEVARPEVGSTPTGSAVSRVPSGSMAVRK